MTNFEKFKEKHEVRAKACCRELGIDPLKFNKVYDQPNWCAMIKILIWERQQLLSELKEILCISTLEN